MAITVKHSKVSTIPDEADTSLVRPSDWNADHTLTGTIDIANGGTGQTTANAAFNALVPSQTGNTGKYLTTDGTDTSWATNPLGTVTSVNLTASTGISVSGGPITTSGSITVTNTAPDQTVVLNSGTGISTSGTYPNFTVTNTAPDQTVSIASGTGISTSGTYPAFTVTNTGVTSAVAGTGISVSSGTGAVTVTNTAPDQTVAIASGTGISVSGTYPNFTVTNTAPSSGGTVTSVGLTTSSAALALTNTPITSSGNIGVNFSGLSSQYVRGDGALANFPTTGGGGSSVAYYFNGSVNQGTFGGATYYEMSKTPIFGAGTNFSLNADGYIAQFITDANDPSLLAIPAGNWNFELFFSASSGGGTPSFYVELYKYDGTTFTLIASDSGSPEGITNGTAIDLYTTALAVPQTTLAVTDRLAIRVYVTHSGKTITLHTEDNNLCQVITTFSTGLNALNGLTAQVQYFATGTSGSDFNISSATDTHTFNLPSASGSNRGLLTSADWTTFNSKVTSVLGTAPVVSSGGATPAISMPAATTSVDGYLTSTNWNTFNNKAALTTNTFTQNQIISVTDNTNAALRITQLGTGNALLVEDSANPDSSPIVIDSTGLVVFGSTTNQAANLATGNAKLQILGGTAPLAFFRDADSSTAINLEFAKRRATGGLLQSGDTIGRLYFSGNDGTAAIPAAFIDAAVDGTPGTNDMPGRLVFSTTADGASTPTERMRIGSAGQIGIGGANYGTSGQVLTSGGASAAPSWTTLSSSGTVTSVAATVPSFLSVAGSPITTSGTLAFTYSGTALPVANGGSGQTSYTNGQLLIGNTTGNTLTKATLTAGKGITVTNGSGSITIDNTSYSVPVSYLVVAGGGGGGSSAAGGGGAGGLLTGTTSLSAGTVYSVVVGGGGTGGTGTGGNTATAGTNGSNSSFSTFTATGGGGGGGDLNGGNTGNGGSGGGGSYIKAAGTGTSGQGNNGGAGGGTYAGGGGGGASAVGQGTPSNNVGGAGGAGTASSITGSSVTYAGGGGGGAYISGTAGVGGAGGGGNGGANAAGSVGTANTGGGGGGSGNNSTNGGNGGSGVVIISVPTSYYTGTTTGSPTVTTSGSNTIITWTSGSGSYTA